ncbi:fibrous sheath-interacting protein 1-like [Montipora capricornis]|uniref:fibrous sheath-interacting protein 1-like n=1 Tax=Montipora capricornis TaxID=246305 RepID=UPI0035F151A7
MEIVSEGSLESISRPGSCDSVRASRDTKKHGQTMGFLEELPPEVVSLSFDEDVESEDDLIISPVENDVIIENIYEGSTATQRSVDDEDIGEGVNLSHESPSQKSGDVVKHTLSEDECCVETEIDPKIKKGLEKIRKLDAILAEKLKKEKDVKTFRKQLEKRWREEISQLDQIREKEGHGKIELSVGHALALGPPTDNDQPDESVSAPVTPVFATQPGLVHSERDNILSPSGRETNSSCDSWAEQDIDEVESKSTKRMRKRKGNRSNMKEKEQNFVKRNIELAADAGSVIPMTEAEKKRLEELLSDETDLFMIENAYVEGLALPEGEGYTLDTESLASLAEIDSKLQELVPEEEMDLLASQESWKTIADSRHSSHDSASGKDVENLGLGERILREDKEMREMKRRLLAIEADLQSLYRENNDESEVSLSDEILAKLIGGSSRTTSRSTTVSESVISALSTCRTDEQTPQQTPAAILDSETRETRPESVQSTSTLVRSEDMEGRSNSQET